MEVEGNAEEKTATSEEPVKPTPVASTANLLPTLLPPLLALILPVPLSFPPLPPSGSSAAPLEDLPKSHPPTTSALSSTHTGALECLNNVLLPLALGAADGTRSAAAGDATAGKAVWDGIWAALALVGVEGVGIAGQEKRMEMWDVAVGVLWGVGGIWKGSIVSISPSFFFKLKLYPMLIFRCLFYQVPDEEQVKVLIQLCETSKDAQLRVKCIGALECLAQCRESISANNVCALSTAIPRLSPHSSFLQLPFR